VNIGPFEAPDLTLDLEPFEQAAEQLFQGAAGLAGEALAGAEALAAAAVDGAAVVVDATVEGLGIAGGFAWRVGEIAVGETVDLALMGPELLELRQRAIDANQGPPAARRHDTPAEAEEFRDLSLAIYDGDQAVPEGYVEVEDAEERLGVPLRDPETGLEARVYYNEEKDLYVLVFEGTTSDDEGADWGSNLSNGLGGVPKQYRQALDIALRFQEVYGEEGDTVVTGHSLGGGLATFAGLGAGIETYTYNPSGLGPGTRLFLDSAGLVERNDELVKNYVQRGEILDLLRAADLAAGLLVTPFAALLYPVLGHLITVGETEYVGQLGRDPITAHNDPDL